VYPPDAGKLTYREALVILTAHGRNEHRRHREVLQHALWVVGSRHKVDRYLPPLPPIGKQRDTREDWKKDLKERDAHIDWAFWKANKDDDKKSKS
jgi:hypothetical protein